MNASMDIISFFINLIKIILGIEPDEGLVRSFFTQVPYPIALIVIAIVFIIILYVVINLLVNFIKTIQNNKIDKRKILFIVAALSIILAGFTVDGIAAANTEKPLFIDKNGEIINTSRHNKLIFIGESPNFRWKFDENRTIKRKLRKKGKDLLYKIEYRYLKNNEKNSFITEAKAVDLQSAVIPGDLHWQVIPGYINNNKFVVLNKYNNSYFLETSYYPSLFEKIKDKKVFTILNTGLPKRGYFGFRSFNKQMGFDYSLAEEIKKEIFRNFPDVSIDYEPESWTKLFTIMQEGKVADIAINTISRTKEREGKYRIKFSEPYFENITLSLIISENSPFVNNNRNITDVLQILHGKRVGVLHNSTADKTLEEFNNILSSSPRYQNTNGNNSEIKIFRRETSENAITDLNKNKTDFVLVDSPYVEAIESNPEYKIKSFIKLTPNLYPPEFHSERIGEDYCIVVNSEHHDFLKKLNQSIIRLKEKGVIARLQKKSKEDYQTMLASSQQCLSLSKNIPSQQVNSCSSSISK